MPPLHRMRIYRRKRGPVPPGQPRDTRQSWPGTISVALALAALFCFLLEGFLRLQAAGGVVEIYRILKPWLIRSEALAVTVGLLSALMSFPFSDRDHRNAAIGLLMNCTFGGAWVAIHTQMFR